MMSGDRQKHIKKTKVLEIYSRATSYKYRHDLIIIHCRVNCDVIVLVTCVLNNFKSNQRFSISLSINMN